MIFFSLQISHVPVDDLQVYFNTNLVNVFTWWVRTYLIDQVERGPFLTSSVWHFLCLSSCLDVRQLQPSALTNYFHGIWNEGTLYKGFCVRVFSHPFQDGCKSDDNVNVVAKPRLQPAVRVPVLSSAQATHQLRLRSLRQWRCGEDHGRTLISGGDAAASSQALGHADSQGEQQCTRVLTQVASFPSSPRIWTKGILCIYVLWASLWLSS